MELQNRVALVTGAGKGMGEGIAKVLARQGADIVVNDVVESDAARVADEISKIGRKTLVSPADISRWPDVESMFKQIVKKFGTIDILVNNAGTTTQGLIETITEQWWDKIMAVNLKGPFLCCKAAIPIMKEKRFGKIVNIASTAARRIGFSSAAAYTASKAGLVGFTRQLAYELAPFNINANAICPGRTMTPLGMNALSPEAKKERLKAIPIGRFAAPEDQGEVVAFLCSQQASYITGAVIDVDGGSMLGWTDYETYRKGMEKK